MRMRKMTEKKLWGCGDAIIIGDAEMTEKAKKHSRSIIVDRCE